MAVSGRTPCRNSKLQWFDWETKRFVDIWAQSDAGSLCCFTTSSPVFSKLVCRPLYFKHVNAYLPTKGALLGRKTIGHLDKDFIFAFETCRPGVEASRIDSSRTDFQIFRCGSKQSYNNWMIHFDSIPVLSELRKSICHSFPDPQAFHKTLDSREHRIPKGRSFSFKPAIESMPTRYWRCTGKVANMGRSRDKSNSPEGIKRSLTPKDSLLRTPKENTFRGASTPNEKPLRTPKEFILHSVGKSSFHRNNTDSGAVKIRSGSVGQNRIKKASPTPSSTRMPSPGGLPPGAFANSCCLLLEAEMREKTERHRRIENDLYVRIEELEMKLREKEREAQRERERSKEREHSRLKALATAPSNDFESRLEVEKKAWVLCMQNEVKSQWEQVEASVKKKDDLIIQQKSRIEELERVIAITTPCQSPMQSQRSRVDTYIKNQLSPVQQESLLDLDAQLDFILEEANDLYPEEHREGFA